jgi:multicomponent Na+:H+ antiporter subunit D
MLDYLKRTPTITLDVDWLWRIAGPVAIHALRDALRIIREGLTGQLLSGRQALADSIALHRRPDGLLLRSWPTGGMALWVMVMLLAYLALYYLG